MTLSAYQAVGSVWGSDGLHRAQHSCGQAGRIQDVAEAQASGGLRAGLGVAFRTVPFPQRGAAPLGELPPEREPLRGFSLVLEFGFQGHGSVGLGPQLCFGDPMGTSPQFTT